MQIQTPVSYLELLIGLSKNYVVDKGGKNRTYWWSKIKKSGGGGGHLSHKDSSSGDHECLFKIECDPYSLSDISSK